MENLIKLILVNLLLAIAPAQALDIRGYSIGQVVVNKESVKNNSDTISAFRVQNINRLNLFHQSSDNFSYELGFELNQSYDHVYSPSAILDYESDTRPYRIEGLTPTFIRSNRYEKRSYTGFVNLDRLMVNYTKNELQMNVGRQPIYFGTSKTANPLDVLTPFSLTQINTAERQGVDAVRVRYPIGIMGQWDFGAVFGESFEADESSAFINAKLNIDSYEFGPLVQRYSKANLLGFEAIKDFKGANLYIEAAYTNPDDFSDYYRQTLGIETLVTPELTLAFEYHYNGAGGTDKNIYTDVNPFSVTKGGVTFLGKHYLNGYLNYAVSGVDTLGLLAYFNVGDNSALVAPNYIRSLSDNQELNFGGFIGLGKRSNTRSVVHSEFGSSDSSIFTKYKFFF